LLFNFKKLLFILFFLIINNNNNNNKGIISNWNLKSLYDKNNCNCQHFIDEILIKLDLFDTIKNLPQDRPFSKFLNNIRKNGSSKFDIEFNDSKIYYFIKLF
jgi:hypothetical protein